MHGHKLYQGKKKRKSYLHVIIDDCTRYVVSGRDLVAQLLGAELIAVDTETTALNPMTAELVGVSFAIREDDCENKWEDDIFGYWSIEYIYDETGRVRMEIYRDAEFKFLRVPRNMSGDIAKKNFIAPILTYEYNNDTLKIKAFDENFNLLKEAIGDKPCIPFIDCGEAD